MQLSIEVNVLQMLLMLYMPLNAQTIVLKISINFQQIITAYYNSFKNPV